MKKIIVILLIVVPAGFIFYVKRDLFRTHDSFDIVNTPDSIKAHVKVYAFVNNPTKVEYKNNKWTSEDGSQAILVYNGSESLGLPKQYKHADFYVTIGEEFFYNNFIIDKENTTEAYNIKFSIDHFENKYYLTGEVLHHRKSKQSFFGHQMYRLSKGVEIIYYRDKGLSKVDFLNY